MRTILIPTDFSENALHAIQYALALFKCERTKIYVLHAYADEVYGPFKANKQNDIEDKKKSIKAASDHKLAELIKLVTAIPPNPRHSFENIAVFDSLVDGVNDYVNKINIDLVIMGTKGKSNDKNIIFGSHTVQLFKYVQCPVLAVPQDAEFRQPKKILFPTNFMLPYKRRELKLLNCLSNEYKSEIHCLYISDFEALSARQIDNKRFLSESLPNSYLFFEQTAVKNKTAAIQEFIKLHQIDFLVMVNSRHSFLEDLLYRSTVDEIGLTTKIPFLVMQNLSR
ncbi:universal stress protein [Aurantibacter crassamenti]|uniref:universal stress protein n=1 Tax=Aurantibacter crassamenti TaxID=1837375 RepID=UPI0019394968|nr:universal stress protein [Aurantibacter crassamenti]MBM1106578.1 universal stress protein [Aurantibacter crassamenti]